MMMRRITQALAVVLVATGVFAAWPALDLAASRSLLGADGRFVLDGNRAIYALNDAITWASRVAVLGLLLASLATLLPAGRARTIDRLRTMRRPLLFLLLSLVLGPGLLVNGLLKEHSGRARPVQTTLFGGTQAFTPAWTPADQCSSNCAFVSGHAAVAAWPVAGAFLARRRGTRRAWLAGGLLAGLAVGLGRMATGSHFLSDVVIAVLLVYLVCAACAAWLLRPPASAAWPAVPRSPDSPAGAAPASRPAD